MSANLNVDFFRDVLENRVPFNHFLGLKLVEAIEGRVVVKLTYKSDLIGDPRKPALHGGVIATLLDAVGGAAGMTTLRSTRDYLATIDLRVDYLKPGEPRDLYAEGKLVRSGGQIIFTHMVAYQGEEKTVVAEGRGVYHVRRNEKKPE